MKKLFTPANFGMANMKKIIVVLSFIWIASNVTNTNNVAAQSCCPEFTLQDAVEICPPEGTCQDGTAGGGHTFAACRDITHTYTVYPNEPAYTYTWTITGGTPTSFTGNPLSILWGTGNTGFIKVVITGNNGCSDTITRQVCLIDGPEADFTMSTDTVCTGTPVIFQNWSLGGSSYLWNMGDGTTFTTFNPPSHSYSSPGTYTVTLTVFADDKTGQSPDQRPCGCIDTISKVIVVLEGTGPVIELDCCYGTVCPGDTSSFCTPTVCPTYNWTVTGGTIVSGLSTSCISVVWDVVYSVPTTVSLETPGCSNAPCPEITTLNVPVLYPNLPISGPTPAVVCQGSLATFSLPTLPGTYYTWTVTPGGTSFNLEDRNTPDVNIIFNSPGTYTVQCNYTNPLAGCSGSSNFTVDVRPVFSIFGNDKACEGSTTTFFSNGVASLWDVFPLGPVVTPQGPSSADIAWTTPGTYVVTAYPQNPASWCNPDAQFIVQVIAKPVLGSIAGNTLVCPGNKFTYSITSNTQGSPFIWTITNGTGIIHSEMGADSDSVIVEWTNSGSWQLSVYQALILNPGDTCASLYSTLNVLPHQLPLITGPSTACVDQTMTYTTAGTAPPDGFQWSINPPGQGTIMSGQGSSSIQVLWHGIPNPSAIVKVQTCSGSHQMNVAVLNPPAQPFITLSNGLVTMYCFPDLPPFNVFLSVPAGYASYQWYFNGILPGETNDTLFIPNGTFTGAGTYVFTVEVSNGSCSVSSSIKIIIGDCGGPCNPVPCDPTPCTIDFSMPDSACVNQKVFFAATPTLSGVLYSWDFGDGATSFVTPTTHAYNFPGTYAVKLTATSPWCNADTTKYITINPLPNCVVIPAGTVFCPGDSMLLTSSCLATFNYQWYKDGSPIAGATANTFYAKKHGEYWFEVANQFGCLNNSDSVYIYMNPLPVAKITGDRSVCAFPNVTANFPLTAFYSSNYTYSWSSNPPGAVFSPNGGNPAAYTNVSLTLPGTLPASFEFILEVTDIVTGCINYDTLCVWFYETPNVSVLFQSGCEGTPYTLVPSPIDPTQYDYIWSNGETTPIITVSTAGFYSLTVTDKVNGCSAFVPAAFIYPKPDLSLFPKGCRTIFCGDTLNLYIPLPLNAIAWPNSYPTAYPQIDWYDNNNNLLGSGENLYFTSNTIGNYQISAVVQNHYGCIDSVGVFCVNVICCHLEIESIVAANASCEETADGSFTIVLSPNSQIAPFTLTQISPPGPSWNILPGVPFTVPDLLPGIYLFTVTDSSGYCAQTIDVEIGFEQQDCCFALTDPGFTKIMSPITYNSDVVWDNKYYIHDGVIVTVNGTVLDITNVDVVFGECAGIEFINGGYLRANNSVFRPCNMHKTWKGLRFENPVTSDTIINMINESTFKNAEVALYFRGGSDGLVSNNLFSNCNYGIRVESNNHFNHPISGNRFVTETFFPDYLIDCRYFFINNTSTYGVYSTSSRFLQQVSHNEFINSIDPAVWPRTFGIFQKSGGGHFTLNSFTDYYNAFWLQNQIFYSGIQNNKIESNVKLTGFTAIYINSCKGPIVEVNKNEISNNYNQFVSPWAIYATKSSSVSILDNLIDGFSYGILSMNNDRVQISKNEVREGQTNGIYILESPGQFSFVTCNVVKMKTYTGTTGLFGQSMSLLSEVSGNCILDCANSMYFGGSATLPALPRIRNNFLYNYNNTGINVANHSGNIGTATDHGMNTLWSNKNSAIDINSSSNITVANNFGMFNISWPFVQITSNNPYHSTASCGQQIFNMPSQGNLNVNYTCDNFKKITEPINGEGGNFYPPQNIGEWLSSSANPFHDAGLILANTENPDISVLNEVIQSAELSANETALLKYEYHLRNSDYENARTELQNFVPTSLDEDDFKVLGMMELNIAEFGWSDLSGEMITKLNQIIEKGSVHSNFAIFMLNNSSTYRDYILNDATIPEVFKSEQVKHIEPGDSFLNIYPNPASGSVFIELVNNNAENGKLELFDISGKRVIDFTLNIVAGGIELDIRNLREGFYIVTLTDPESGYVQKGKLVKNNK